MYIYVPCDIIETFSAKQYNQSRQKSSITCNPKYDTSNFLKGRACLDGRTSRLLRSKHVLHKINVDICIVTESTKDV